MTNKEHRTAIAAFKLEPSLKEELRKRAYLEKTTISQVIHGLVKESVQEGGRK